MIFDAVNQKLAHQAIKDSFTDLKRHLKRLGYYKAYSIVTLAEACYHQDNTKHQEKKLSPATINQNPNVNQQ